MFLAVILTILISGTTGAQINEDFGIAPVQKQEGK